MDKYFSDLERREKAKQDVIKLGELRPFSQVYSKQYAKTNKPIPNKETNMNEFYQLIEEKIKASGYDGEISGSDIYNEVSDFIDDKDNGTYIFMSKPEDDIIYEYHVDVYQDEFNLSSVTITAPKGTYHINFDD